MKFAPNKEDLMNIKVDLNCTIRRWVFTLGGVLALLSPVVLAEISAVSVGNNYSCLVQSGAVECGGENTEGQLDVPLLQNVRSLSAGARGTVCEISDDGLSCWGRQSDGPFFGCGRVSTRLRGRIGWGEMLGLKSGGPIKCA